MKLSLKSPKLEALRSTVYGLLWTKHGLQIVRPGDYIVKAATGCTYRLKADTVDQYYNIENNPDTLKNFAEKMSKPKPEEHACTYCGAVEGELHGPDCSLLTTMRNMS